MRPALGVLVAVVLGGCGPEPPQAPFAQAKKLDSATSGISNACGESYQVTAFPGDHARQLDALDAKATVSVRKLSSVYRADPAWIYQGQTVGTIVQEGFTSLQSCGLRGAATLLARSVRRR